MNRTTHWSAFCISLVLLAGLAACGDERGVESEVRQTQYPGQVTAGGGTSGEVLAGGDRDPVVPGPEGTPGIPQGAGGTVGGAALGGTVPEKPPVTDTDAKSAEQARKGEIPVIPQPGTPAEPLPPASR